ncbi:MFS transporter [Streptomyces chartreusis]|uniref:MFS transporter n=1 Tax=Streptomyces chartreusis TaxID=1969 RepID=A0A7H8TBK5_STRCX|nr:MFS transporter [Streptomyces chartreusis]QKZ20342.1 MFS transporter [Streptomyces chartreusis]
MAGTFAVLGLGTAVWGARLPAVQAAAHAGAGQLGLVLLGAAAGAVTGLKVGGRLADTHGPSRLLIGPAVALGFTLVLLGQCRALPSLIVGAMLFGLANGLLDIAMNSAAVNCERAFRRPIMGSFHAAYSGGGLCGALLAATTTWIPHTLLFATVGMLTVLAAIAAVPSVRRAGCLDEALESTEVTARRSPASFPRAAVWLLGAMAAAVLLGEGAAADWAAVHLTDLDASQAVAAAAFAVYSAAMAAGRLCADRLITRYGAPAVVRAGTGLAAAGLGVGLAVGTVPAALVGWMVLGLGLSTAFPCMITAAGRAGPGAVSTVAAAGNLGKLTGPAAIGALAAPTSLPAALALPVVLAAAVALASHRALRSSWQ